MCFYGALSPRATCLFFLHCTPLLNHVFPSEFHFASFPFLSSLHGLWVRTVESKDGSYSACAGATAGLQERVLGRVGPGVRGGRQAGNRRGNTHVLVFLLSSGPQAGRGWGRAEPGWMLTFHAAAFHCAKPSFLSLCPCPPHSLCPAPGWD